MDLLNSKGEIILKHLDTRTTYLIPVKQERDIYSQMYLASL